MRISLAVLLLFFAMQISANEVSELLDSLFVERYSDNVPGAQFIVAKNGNVIYENAKGVADFSTGAKITEDTRFNIASISKQFTAVSILKLHEENKLSINDSVLKYFPDYNDIFRHVKLRNLMSHTSGIPDNRPRTNREWCLTVTDEGSMEYMKNVNKLKFQPGTQYDYINPTFQLLYAIIEKVSGQSFVDFQQQNIFSVAGMENSFYFDAENLKIPNVAHGYVKENQQQSDDRDIRKSTVYTDSGYEVNGNVWHEYDYGEETFFATKADGGIYSTARDLLKWEEALSSCLCIGKKYLSMAYAPQIEVYGSKWCSYQNRPGTFYGLGWFVENQPGFPQKVYHTGDNGGFQSYLAKYPDSGVVIILLENRNDYDRWIFARKVDCILKKCGLFSR